MATTVEAIYEGGVFRPLRPISLAEGSRVEVIVEARQPTDRARPPAEILAEIAGLPLEVQGDDFTSRDHDQTLYGEQGAR